VLQQRKWQMMASEEGAKAAAELLHRVQVLAYTC
jgi:hypothetical protein